MSHLITSDAELDAIYGQPSGGAVIKEIDHISDHYRMFIELAPFVVVATLGPGGARLHATRRSRGFRACRR